MICTECNGRGETIYYVETDRDENTVTMEQRKGICRTCNGIGKKPMSNADRIRSMTDEELAKVLNAFTAYFVECNRSADEVDCKDCELNDLCSLNEGKAIEWLQQPVKEE